MVTRFACARLRDRAKKNLLLVTLDEATEVHEASRLQEWLDSIGIEPFVRVVNASLVASRDTQFVIGRARRSSIFLLQADLQCFHRVVVANFVERRERPTRTDASMMRTQTGAGRTSCPSAVSPHMPNLARPCDAFRDGSASSLWCSSHWY